MSLEKTTFRQRVSNPRSIAWIASLALIAGCCAAWSSLPSLDSAPRLRVALFAIMGVSMLGTVFLFPETTHRNARRIILLSAILLRFILWPAPVSDDVNRYLWEGQLVAAGENPYASPADDPRWQDRRDATWQAMNHRDRPTAYPPGIQWVMAAATAISPFLKAFKALALLGDLATLFLLLALLRENTAPLRWAGFYAFNPVILISFAAEAHFDSLMVAALLAATLAARRGNQTAWLWLGFAIQIKLVCLILVPLFLTKKSIHGSWLILPFLILPSLPFLSALPGWIHGVTHFANSGAFNAPLFTLLASAGTDPGIVRALCLAAFGFAATAIVIARWRGLDLTSSILWMLGALLACSPIVHFWYLAWLLPLAAIRPSFAWTAASITMAGYFLAWETQHLHGWWGFGHGIAAAIWIPWTLAGIAQNRFLPARIRSPKPAAQPFGLCIVLPVVETNGSLIPLINSLRSETSGHTEIIIVSSSPCPEIPGARLIVSPLGRGNQIAAGFAATTAPWILIAHADTTPRAGFAAKIENAVQKNPGASLIVLGQRFDRSGAGTLLIEALNELRVVFGGVAFGDQTMVVRRSAMDAAGGFPAQPLMEDVEASLRLAAHGEIVYLGREWEVSARKWERGFAARFSMVVRLVATYQFARLRGKTHAKAASEWMYREYYPGQAMEK